MNTVAVIASVIVGVAFLVAGASKIAAGGAWPAQATGLGAPKLTIPLVPWVEIMLGAGLVVQLARRPFAVVALGVLVAFTLLIARRLAEGKRPPCACFGAWSSKPLGAGHLIRNAALMAVAVVAAL